MRFILCLVSFFFLATSALAEDFTITTNAFLDTGALPVMYTCDGKDISPDLSWSNPPSNTKSFAIIASDPQAPKGVFYHWVLFNIPATTKGLDQGTTNLPKGTMVGKNSWGKLSYNGPCPPKGSVHTYYITLYALDAILNLPKDADAEMVLAKMQGHILKQIKLTMVYSRWLT